MYKTIRTVHLICGALSLPFLVMYGISAVQMAHSKWFSMKPVVTEKHVEVPAGLDARALARQLRVHGVRGELAQVKENPAGMSLRVTVPGTVHEITTDRSTNRATIKTSVGGALGMLNRLHHLAGLYYSYGPLNLWGMAVAVVSVALIGLGGTGLWMWWLRRQERTAGLVLLAANLIFSIVVLGVLRAAGP